MSDMGIFGDLDLASAKDDPFKVEDGTYVATITSSEVKAAKNNEQNKGLQLIWTIEEGGLKVREWKGVPDKNRMTQEEYDQARSFLKQRLLSIGIPEERMNTFIPSDALGITRLITVKNNGDFTNITRVAELDGVAGGSSNADANAFAGL